MTTLEFSKIDGKSFPIERFDALGLPMADIQSLAAAQGVQLDVGSKTVTARRSNRGAGSGNGHAPALSATLRCHDGTLGQTGGLNSLDDLAGRTLDVATAEAALGENINWLRQLAAARGISSTIDGGVVRFGQRPTRSSAAFQVAPDRKADRMRAFRVC